MFVRVKKINGYEYLYLVENAREGGRHVQRVIKSLGRKGEVEESGMLDSLIASAARHSPRSIVLSRYYKGELPELKRQSIGADLVFGRLWETTGIREVLNSLLADRRFGFDVERAIYMTVLHRLMISGSDLHASDWKDKVRIPGAEPVTPDQAYRAMTWLGEEMPGPAGPLGPRTMTDVIEEALYRYRKDLLGVTPEACIRNDVSAAFFDTISLYFEGEGGATLGQRGHSKDYRPHLKQMVLGIVLDGHDRPIASFLLPGNTVAPEARIRATVTTLVPVVHRLQERFGIKRACVVADRGMISAATIKTLEAAGVDYVLGARERSVREIYEQVITDDGVPVPLVIPRQKGETRLEVRDVTIDGRRYVVCRNEEEAAKDAETRAKILAGLKTALEGGDMKLVANTGYRRYLKTPKDKAFTIDPAKVEADARFDGLFVLRVNTRLTALQAVLRYRHLLAVEDTFRTGKALLATRPIDHKTDANIQGHVFCTFLALVLRHELVSRLAPRGPKAIEWTRIVDDLADLSHVEVEQDGKRARLRTAPGPTIDPICRAVGITLPPVYEEMPPLAR
ncbi:MAG: transposase [Alphaproteobacteria bacterium]